MSKTATLIKDNLPGFRGHAALYRLSEPLSDRSWDDEPAQSHEYVVVSAANVMFSGPETYIFGADEDGRVENWGELPGSFKGALDHAFALSSAGYVIA